jgi:murein DD-endopeptidase MepM/ murein hydrolase activator NlpD
MSRSQSNDAIYTASVPSSIQQNDGGGTQPIQNASVTRTPITYGTSSQERVTSQPIYRQPTYAEPAQAPVTTPQPQVAAAPTTNMIAENGEVQVEPGMTLFAIARANNVPVKALAQANNISPPYAVRTGQVLRLPGASQNLAADVSEKPSLQMAKAGGGHTVRQGETLFSLGRKYGVSPYAIAQANGLSKSAPLSIGQTLQIPGGGTKVLASAPAEEQVEDAGSDEGTIAKTETDSPPAMKQAEAPEAASGKDQSKIASAPTADDEAPAADPSLPAFRWPVKGRVISEYGAKPNGLRNEGINIAVPEGTSVRAADSGVVAYAGNELKGYGNLVLIRHEGGWVTAYAHNKELFVKRGDTVKRGDIVAKAGQTGSVSSPQVHFEIRKGATAMDPMKFLNGATAAN